MNFPNVPEGVILCCPLTGRMVRSGQPQRTRVKADGMDLVLADYIVRRAPTIALYVSCGILRIACSVSVFSLA